MSNIKVDLQEEESEASILHRTAVGGGNLEMV
jgi:hypothetical protein